MDASAAGAPRGWRVPRSFSLVSLARLDRATAAHTVMGNFCARRDARRYRLADGCVRPPGAAHPLTALDLLVLLHTVDVARTVRGGAARTGALALASAVTLQATLGIATLIHQVPLALALPHQAVALAVLAIAVVHAERLAREPTQVGVAARDAAMRHWGQAT